MSNVKKLILVDHDGTLCQTSAFAYDSIRYCIEHAINKLNLSVDSDNLNIHIEQALRETVGTTEKNLLKRIAFILALSPEKIEKFQEHAYQGRVKWYKSMKAHDEFIYDTYYHDVEQLLKDLKANGNICMLVTGNPREVAKERLTGIATKYFTDTSGEMMGAFGDEDYTREGMIKLAISRAEEKFGKNFEGKVDANGFYENVFYMGDTRHDYFAGLRTRVKTIWLPSRSLQVVKDIMLNDYILLIRDVLQGEMIISNNAYSEEVKKFIGI